MAERIARVEAIERLDDEVLEVVARMVDPPELPWRAGQFVSLACGPEVRRSYTMLNPPAPPHDRLHLCVRTLATGAGSAYVKALAPGDALHFTGPMGFFVLDELHRGDAVMLATGIGMVALLPMIAE